MIYGSVCSGIEAASVAWSGLGWEPAWFSEIEPFPSAVLAYRWPEVVNLGDMTAIASLVSAGEIPAPDLMVGGTPCQAFSVAGLRNGLSDPRGQLTLSYVKLADAIDNKRRERGEQPAIFVWENVPGVLTSKDNAFGCFLAGLAGENEALQPPGGKWLHAGCVYGPKRSIAWIVKDAQYFGVAQRRKRVFVIASARADIDPATILFELESLRRDTPPRREAGKAVAALTARGVGTCGADDNQGQAGHLIAAYGGGNCSGELEVATACTAHGHRLDFDTETFIAETFSSNGAGSFGTGIGPLRAKTGAEHESLAVFNWQAGGNTSATLGADEHVTGALQSSQHPAIAFSYKDHGADAATELSPALRAGNHDTSHANGGQPPAVVFSLQDVTMRDKSQGGKGWNDKGPSYTLDTAATQGVAVVGSAFAENSRGEIRLQDGDGQITGPLYSGGVKPGQGFPAVVTEPYTLAIRGRVEGSSVEVRNDGTANALLTPNGGRAGMGVGAIGWGMQVRRLTPRECERLQGFPDDHTLIPYGRKVSPEKMDRDYAKYLMRGGKLTFDECCDRAADGPRYRAIGNSMAVPVMRWIGERIMKVISHG